MSRSGHPLSYFMIWIHFRDRRNHIVLNWMCIFVVILDYTNVISQLEKYWKMCPVALFRIIFCPSKDQNYSVSAFRCFRGNPTLPTNNNTRSAVVLTLLQTSYSLRGKRVKEQGEGRTNTSIGFPETKSFRHLLKIGNLAIKQLLGIIHGWLFLEQTQYSPFYPLQIHYSSSLMSSTSWEARFSWWCSVLTRHHARCNDLSWYQSQPTRSHYEGWWPEVVITLRSRSIILSPLVRLETRQRHHNIIRPPGVTSTALWVTLSDSGLFVMNARMQWLGVFVMFWLSFKIEIWRLTLSKNTMF